MEELVRIYFKKEYYYSFVVCTWFKSKPAIFALHSLTLSSRIPSGSLSCGFCLSLFIFGYVSKEFACLGMFNVRKPHQSNPYSVCLCMCIYMYIYWIFSNLYQISISKWMKQLLASYNSLSHRIKLFNFNIQHGWMGGQRVYEMFLYRFSMLFATCSPSRRKGNNVHVMNNLNTTVISFFILFHMYVH